MITTNIRQSRNGLRPCRVYGNTSSKDFDYYTWYENMYFVQSTGHKIALFEDEDGNVTEYYFRYFIFEDVEK